MDFSWEIILNSVIPHTSVLEKKLSGPSNHEIGGKITQIHKRAIHQAQNIDNGINTFSTEQFLPKIKPLNSFHSPSEQLYSAQIDWKAGWNKFTLQGCESSCINFTKTLC